jgi:hypothetical protein
VQCSAVECSAVQCSAVQCSAVQCSAVQCSAVQCSAVQCSAVQCRAVQCNAVQCSAVQCSAVHEYGPPLQYSDLQGTPNGQGAQENGHLAITSAFFSKEGELNSKGGREPFYDCKLLLSNILLH